MLICLERSLCFFFFFVQAEDGIRVLVRSRGLGDVYKRQALKMPPDSWVHALNAALPPSIRVIGCEHAAPDFHCLLYTSDAADERSSVDLGGRRIIKKKTNTNEVKVTRVMITNIKSATNTTQSKKI